MILQRVPEPAMVGLPTLKRSEYRIAVSVSRLGPRACRPLSTLQFVTHIGAMS